MDRERNQPVTNLFHPIEYYQANVPELLIWKKNEYIQGVYIIGQKYDLTSVANIK